MSGTERQEEDKDGSQHSTVVWTKPKARHECQSIYILQLDQSHPYDSLKR
jgi:hypothetical protein